MPGGSGYAEMTTHAALNNQGYAVGNNFGLLQQGMLIGIQGKNAQGVETLDTFSVIHVTTRLDKSTTTNLQAALTTDIPPGTRLILITCSGDVNAAISSSNFNTVVYAGAVSSALA